MELSSTLAIRSALLLRSTALIPVVTVGSGSMLERIESSLRLLSLSTLALPCLVYCSRASAKNWRQLSKSDIVIAVDGAWNATRAPAPLYSASTPSLLYEAPAESVEAPRCRYVNSTSAVVPNDLRETVENASVRHSTRLCSVRALDLQQQASVQSSRMRTRTNSYMFVPEAGA